VGTNKPTDQRTTDQRTNGPTDQWTNGPMVQRTNGPRDQRTNGPTDQRTNGPTDQQTNGPTEQRTNRPTNEESYRGACSRLKRILLINNNINHQIRPSGGQPPGGRSLRPHNCPPFSVPPILKFTYCAWRGALKLCKAAAVFLIC
jgi:hypothetical protein